MPNDLLRKACVLLLLPLALNGCVNVLQAKIKTDQGLSAYYDREDKQQAFSLYQEAANLGSVEGQYLLGLMYLEGDGIQQDTRTGLAWVKKAADQGYAAAHNKLGFLYLSGHRGVTPDIDRAIEHLQTAGQMGEFTAMLALGMIYSGHPQLRDENLAASWYEKARNHDTETSSGLAASPASSVLMHSQVSTQDATTDRDAALRVRDSNPVEERQLVVSIQQYLKALGYDPGVADGIAGKRTRKAVRQFQVDYKLEVDGNISPELLLAMKQARGQ